MLARWRSFLTLGLREPGRRRLRTVKRIEDEAVLRFGVVVAVIPAECVRIIISQGPTHPNTLLY